MKNDEAARILERILDEDGCYLTESARAALQMGADALRGQKSEEEREQALWIPIAERKPIVGHDVLFSLSGVYAAEGCLRDDGDWWQFRWDATVPGSQVDAWRPLPASYRGGQYGKS